MRTLTLLVLAIACAAQAQQTTLDDLPPQTRLGARVEALRQAWPTAPVVAIAPDPETALDLIGLWTPRARFPVLIDDGSARSREDIARFVRTFAPDQVFALPAPAQRAPAPPSTRVDQAYARVWGAATPEQIPARWADAHDAATPGVVVADESDQAWIAAAALAIGRGQALVWVDAPGGGLARNLRADEIAALDHAVTARLDELRLDWRELGDTIDAVTLCLNMPTRVAPPDDRGPRALTDRIGRHDDGARWAWCGQILGDAPAALYTAMCALFLHNPQRAWLFDGYEATGPYAQYGVADAATLLESAKIELHADRAPGGSLTQWLRRCARAVDAGFIHVNTAGHRRWFNLNPGRGVARDIPLLARPAAVHFIHSFSAQDPADPESIASTWLARGAFCYFGAMDEPFLSAFQPPHAVTRRLLAGAPWGVATRLDGAPWWKLNVFGDPLYTMSPHGDRSATPPTFEGAVDVAARLRASLGERNLDAAARDLALLGRDDDLLRLARATLADRNAAAGPGLADAALHAAARKGEIDLVAPLFQRLAPDRQQDQRVREIVWLALRPDLSGDPSRDVIAALQRCAGGQSLARDAEQLGRTMARVLGPEAGAAYLRSVAATVNDARERSRLEDVAKEYAR